MGDHIQEMLAKYFSKLTLQIESGKYGNGDRVDTIALKNDVEENINTIEIGE